MHFRGTNIFSSKRLSEIVRETYIITSTLYTLVVLPIPSADPSAGSAVEIIINS